MGFTINDSNFEQVKKANIAQCGCLPRKSTYGSLPFARAESIDLIPWEEFPDRIADQERNKSSLEHIWRDNGKWCLHQKYTNFCWAFSGATAIMLERAAQNLPFVFLSGSSIACPVVNFQNMGYYPEEALKQLCNVGAAPVDYVPEVTVDPQDFKRGWREAAARNKVTLWGDVKILMQEIFTRVALNQPMPVGLGWWEHSVCFARLIDKYPRAQVNNPNRYSIKFLNSYGGEWGDEGWGEVEGSRMIPDQAYVIRQATFS